MPPTELRRLRQLAREMLLPAAALQAALECGVLDDAQSLTEQARLLRRMRRLMGDLGVGAPAAALLVRMRRDLDRLQLELARVRRLEDQHLNDWREGWWREVDK
ncbi:MAG: hypothetical protein IT318_12400 [Anaerolineales bacterium]|nr:hypothetical protein [Anaerolineales bacterium]